MAKELERVNPSDSVSAFFAWALKMLREQAHLTQRQLAELTCFSTSLLAQVETVQRMPPKELAEICDRVLDGHDFLTNLWPLLSRGTYDEFYRTFAQLEASALRRREFEARVVPGLFQTEQYMRTLTYDACGDVESETSMEARVVFRLTRQRLLTMDNPASHWAIIDEAALRRRVGTRAIMREQFDHLVELAKLPHVFIQILPLARPCATGSHDSMSIFTYPKGREIAYADALDFGYVVSDEAKVAHYALNYDKLRAQALPLDMSLDLLSSIAEEP